MLIGGFGRAVETSSGIAEVLSDYVTDRVPLDELQRYVEAGVTPREALASATLTGPKFLGHADRFGAVANGKAADILILDANPLQDIGATRQIRGVVMKGKWLDRAALDQLLEIARVKAAKTE